MVHNISALAMRLQDLVARILSTRGYSVVNVSEDQAIGVDFLASSLATSETTAVDVKLYRSPKIETRVLRNAAASIARVKKQLGFRGLLVATTTFEDRDKRLLRNIGVDEVWDISELREQANVDSRFAAELDQLLRDAELVYTALRLEMPVLLSADAGWPIQA